MAPPGASWEKADSVDRHTRTRQAKRAFAVRVEIFIFELTGDEKFFGNVRSSFKIASRHK